MAQVSKVLVIFTGGTFGMLRNKDNGKIICNTESTYFYYSKFSSLLIQIVLAPIPNKLVKLMRTNPHMNDANYEHDSGNDNFLCLPYIESQTKRILYKIVEYSPLIDSSNITFEHWIKIAEDIKVRTNIL